MRAKLLGGGDLEFAKYLLRVGEGKEGEEVDGEMWIQIPQDVKSESKSIEQFCDEMFPGLKEVVASGMKNRLVSQDKDWIDWLISRGITVPINDDAAEVNQILINKLAGEETVYKSADSLLIKKKSQDDGDISNELKFPPEYLNSISLPSLPPHRLVLKPGTPVMLMRNLDPHNGHVNSARYIVKGLHKHLIHLELATGMHKGKDLVLPRIYFNPKGTCFQFMQRKQFPIKPCFTFTSNKSQGQNLEKNGIYLKREFFGHGQLYVAMSRVGSFKNLKVFKAPSNEHQAKMRNVVYTGIL